MVNTVNSMFKRAEKENKREVEVDTASFYRKTTSMTSTKEHQGSKM